MDYFVMPRFKGVCDVQKNFTTYFNLLTNKVSSLFLWKNLPSTIDRRYLEFSLLLNGKVCWFNHNDKLYALTGNIGGEPNVYYEPTNFIIANPVIGSKQLRVRTLDGDDENLDALDGILMGNSDVDFESGIVKGGLYSLIYQTAGLLADNISSLNIAQLNSRLSVLFTADSDAQARSGEIVLKDIYDGKPYKILAQDLVEKFGITAVAASGANNTLMSLIQSHQYILAQFFNEIGITSNWNCKRERLNTAEVEMNEGCLDINIFSMLRCRQEAVERINAKFGTNIEVELNWAVFNEANGANPEEDNEASSDEPTEEEKEMGAGITESSDDDYQVDGVSEDKVEEPEEKEDRAESLEEAVDETIEGSDKNED